MQITDSLNLAIPFGNGLVAYHAPIDRAVYEANYAVLHATLATMSKRGVHYLRASGPSIASLVLKDEAKREAAERGEKVDSVALLGEIKRLTTVLSPSPSGYETLPVDVALEQGKFDAEDWSELEASLVFFTCLVQTAKKSDRAIVANSAASVMDGSITSSAITAYVASLQISTKVEPTANLGSSPQPSDTSPAMGLPI
ncbi:hypothetical protein [Burkholderia lata]|uniref:Uncharacterized protein n=1 Tax=Burkholderia lata (strain ATCC 17760 / DSM 23089 / LMG 22485 / NCIMB 9086 / R18194 / 383) TaxID=482957 RepID=A0A6P2GRF0_BURL3|nr:hypothetical protein [Burkholderia lata]VWB07102.1 hypothetical protein BLA6863_00150 [Burkholderia lata]